MKHEKFNGTTEQGKYTGHFDGVDRTTSSQGNRADAHNDVSRHVKFNTWSQEYDWLVCQKQLITADLGRNRDEVKLQHKEHMAARKPIQEWVAIEKEFNEKRVRLVDDLRQVEARIAVVKPRAMQERRMAPHANDNPLVTLLTEIRDLLREAIGHSTDGPKKPA